MNDERPQPVVHVDGLRFGYKKRMALRDVTFDVMPGEIHGFVGPNGAGKTTTLKVLGTLLDPHDGVAKVFGHDVRRRPKEVRRRIGFMPDHLSLYSQMTVFECLDFFGAAYGLSLKERNRVITDVLALTDMTDRRGDLVKSLSRGMQQRISLARALVHDPDLLLLDEPAAGLDPRARIELMEVLRELARMGKTIFISSHILAELAELCNAVTIIDRGETRFTGPMEALLDGSDGLARFVLTLAVPLADAVERLRELEGVVEAEQKGEEPVYLVMFDTASPETNAVLRTIMDAGGVVVSFRRAGRELAEAFIELTTPGVPE
jgi:ABC-2 type transport system ATP-binding protein